MKLYSKSQIVIVVCATIAITAVAITGIVFYS